MNPKISVIVPVYKVEQYLEKCITSILNQTFKDFELLLIDDGSPDRCGAICDAFAAKDERIRVFHRENQGIARVRSFGVSQVKGEYICFVDSDDYVFENYLERLYSAITTTDAKIAVCGHINFQDGEREPQLSDYPSSGAIEVKRNAIDEYIADLEHTERYVCVWDKIYERNVWENVDFPADKIYEDMYVWYKLLDNAGSVAFLDDILYARRLNDGSITHQPYSLEQWYMVDSKMEQLEYFKNQGKQRLVEISFDSIMHFFWTNINGMKEKDIKDDNIINEYRSRMKKYVKCIKPSDTYPLKDILKQYYIVYLKKIS